MDTTYSSPVGLSRQDGLMGDGQHTKYAWEITRPPLWMKGYRKSYCYDDELR